MRITRFLAALVVVMLTLQTGCARRAPGPYELEITSGSSRSETIHAYLADSEEVQSVTGAVEAVETVASTAMGVKVPLLSSAPLLGSRFRSERHGMVCSVTGPRGEALVEAEFTSTARRRLRLDWMVVYTVEAFMDSFRELPPHDDQKIINEVLIAHVLADESLRASVGEVQRIGLFPRFGRPNPFAGLEDESTRPLIRVITVTGIPGAAEDDFIRESTSADTARYTLEIKGERETASCHAVVECRNSVWTVSTFNVIEGPQQADASAGEHVHPVPIYTRPRTGGN